jgi:hypothetical protein
MTLLAHRQYVHGRSQAPDRTLVIILLLLGRI